MRGVYLGEFLSPEFFDFGPGLAAFDPQVDFLPELGGFLGGYFGRYDVVQGRQVDGRVALAGVGVGGDDAGFFLLL